MFHRRPTNTPYNCSLSLIALTATGFIWVRYSFVIIPVNYSLAAVRQQFTSIRAAPYWLFLYTWPIRLGQLLRGLDGFGASWPYRQVRWTIRSLLLHTTSSIMNHRLTDRSFCSYRRSQAAAEPVKAVWGWTFPRISLFRFAIYLSLILKHHSILTPQSTTTEHCCK